MSRPITAEELARARRMLMRRDRVLGAIIKRHGQCGLRAERSPDIYCGLIQAIISQQLSTKAAATIYARFRALLPADTEPTPQAVLPLTDETLRGVGLSRQKISYLRDLSQKTIDGALQADSLASRADDEVIEILTKIKGIGRWTAEMILIFRLLRPEAASLSFPNPGCSATVFGRRSASIPKLYRALMLTSLPGRISSVPEAEFAEAA